MSASNLFPDVEIPPFLPVGMGDTNWEENAEERLSNVSAKAFKAYLRTRRIGSFHIETYEESIEAIKEKVVGTTIPLDADQSLFVGFEDVRLERPSTREGSKDIPLYPIDCRVRSLHYTGKLTARPVLVTPTSRHVSKDRVSLCDLPIMVRSKYCNLSAMYKRYDSANDVMMRARQTMAKAGKGGSFEVGLEKEFSDASAALNGVGADPADPGCYFVMDGVPRIIILTEKLRLNIPYVYMESGKTVLSVSMWSPRPITSIMRIVGVNLVDRNGDESLSTSIFLQNSIFSDETSTRGVEIFKVFRMLGVETEEAMITLIRRLYPTYGDPKRASVIEGIIALCTNTLNYSYGIFANDDEFFNYVYRSSFKKHILKMYPLNETFQTTTAESSETGSLGEEGEDDDAVSLAATDASTDTAMIRAWCQRVLCSNLMTHMRLAGEGEDDVNIGWYDPADETLIKVYHPGFTREVHSRVYCLAHYLIKYSLTRLGELSPVNRDSWENKRLLTSGERFTTQFHHSFFRAVKWDKTAKKVTTTVSEMARHYWDRLDDPTRAKIIDGRVPVNIILDQIKIKSSFAWSDALVHEGMTEEERKEAEKLVFEKLDRKNMMCDLACRHDSDIIVPLVLEDYWNAFKRRSWGIRGIDSFWEANVTDTLNVNQSDLHTYNQLCQVVVRTNDQSKNIQPRLVQESQMYFVCPVVTPEGPNVGNTKQLAVGTVVSASHLRRDDIARFRDLVRSQYSPGLYRTWSNPETGEDRSGLCRLLYNGVFVGLCDGMQMRDFLVKARGDGRFFRDCCIAFDELFQLHVTTEGSRLMRPVFRLNKETGRPMFLEDKTRKYFEKPYLMGTDWEEMERLGYIDYVDAWEQMAGFYSTTGGRPFFIRGINDVPEEDRSVANIYKPFPTGLLIANSIWEVYQSRNRASFILNKIQILEHAERLISRGRLSFDGVGEALITLSYGAMARITDEDIASADQVLYGFGEGILREARISPDKKIGEGKTARDVVRDSLRALSTTKSDYDRESSREQIISVVIDFIRRDLAGCRRVLADLTLRGRYTHAAVNPAMLYSAVALDIPYLSHIHGPRANLASKFNQQAIRGRHVNHDVLMPTEVKVLERPEIPLVVTSTSGFTGLAHHPAGQNVIVAVACFEGENQEDSLIFNRRSIEQGMFQYTRYYTETLSRDSDEMGIFGMELYHRGASRKGDIKFGRHEVIHGQSARYRHISRRGGLPKPGWFLNPRDCIIAAYEGDDIDRSIYVKEDGAGYVDRVTVTRNFAGNPVVKVRIRQVLEPIVGDKFSSRHAQKCTIGRIVDPEDMPYVSGSGIRPDIIMNPHALPSRQTVGQVIEMVAAKAALLKGERVVADVFDKPNIRNMTEILQAYGYDKTGQEVLIDPKTGLKFSSKVLIGPCYYQALKHQVKFKIQGREGYGAADTITGQPVGGRQVRGGTKEGTMETAILNISDNMALHQCMVSDAYPVRVCSSCGSYVTASDTTPEGECRAVKCTYCDNLSTSHAARLRTLVEMTPTEEIPQTILSSIKNNFISWDRIVEEVPAAAQKTEEFMQTLTSFLDTPGLQPHLSEALRKAWFPRAFVGDADMLPSGEDLDGMILAARDFWTTVSDAVKAAMPQLYLSSVSSDVIRPILSTDWKTTILPQSSMVFFRYINQMGYRTRFRFTPGTSVAPPPIPPEVETEVLNETKRFIAEGGSQTDLILHLKQTFPDLAIQRGTPIWGLIQATSRRG